MPSRFLRPLLVFEFLIAVQVVFTFWSQVGGQYHLDLMFWPWKFALSLAAAFLVTAITANLARANGALTRRSWLYVTLLLLTMVVAGVVTYYYHLNEPVDEDQDQGDEQTAITKIEREYHNPYALAGNPHLHSARFGSARGFSGRRAKSPGRRSPRQHHL
ncbi:MAG TPA: hypothetical protein VHB50_09280 [Bryobacteraceae bacterium]|nr:hypothetical protein [Bryobacteraceae bacterium]